ncbi:MAG: DNA-formamidopyrimidine glycosylase family protein [Pedobacter agri]
MPELPDLAVMARNLNKKLHGKTVKHLQLHVAKKTTATEEELFASLIGRSLNSVVREGKELRLFFGENVLGLHLMLHGKLKLTDGDAPKFTIFHLSFGTESLYLTDFQNQARPILNPQPSTIPDALEITQDQFSNLLSKKKTDIKTVLLDQKNIRGIGNAYADEILYEAGIAPQSVACKVPSGQLFTAMVNVLESAIEQISKADPERLTGENRDFMKVHLPKTEKTKKGETIIIDKRGSRKSYYVSSQKVF